ncbi:MAG: macro domain-containing protein [Cetobacterium sp.]
MGFVFEREGDIFTTTAPAIGHGVNVDGFMASGIAVTVRERYPEMYELYRDHCKKGGMEPGGMLLYGPAPLDGKYIMNIASQDRPGKNAKYEWLHQGLSTAMGACDHYGLDVLALPRIGAGIGGLEWDSVLQIIHHLAPHYRVDIEVWTYNRNV